MIIFADITVQSLFLLLQSRKKIDVFFDLQLKKKGV